MSSSDVFMKFFPSREEQESLQAVQGEKTHTAIKDFANHGKYTHMRERQTYLTGLRIDCTFQTHRRKIAEGKIYFFSQTNKIVRLLTDLLYQYQHSLKQ